jgi:hypothetical protein
LTKTGTTYLQKNIFPFLFQETYNYYGKHHSWHSFRGGNYVEGENNFWSEEDSWMGGVDPQRFSYKRAEFWKSINYLREKVSDIRLILVLRHHEPWLKSLYLHDAKTRGRFWRISLDEYVSYFDRNYLRWSYQIDLLKDFNLLLLNYEDLKNKPENFIKAICDFSELEIKNNIINDILSKNKESPFVNLSPKTNLEMRGSQLYTKYEYYFSIANAILNRMNLKKQISRDLFIKIARNFPRNNNERVKNIKLKNNQIKENFSLDWSETWIKAKKMPNIKTIDDFMS